MRIQLYLKAPRPGSVKTRLAKDLGDSEACRIYRLLVTRQLSAIPADAELELHFAPADARAELEAWLGEDRTLLPQCEGDLGDRLAHGIRHAFAEGVGAVCVIGADCPALGEAHFKQAEDLLNAGHDAVFGPTRDGGYYLLALRTFLPELFQDIPWSTDQTLAASIKAAEKAKRKVAFLEILDDIDVLSDWQRTSSQISSSAPASALDQDHLTSQNSFHEKIRFTKT